MENNNFEVTSLKQEWLKDIEKKFKEYKEKYPHYVREDGGIECYTDYRERELSTSFLSEIFDTDDPEQAFHEKLEDWAIDYEDNAWDELVDELKAECSEEELEFWEENEDDVMDLIRENFYYYYDPKDFNNDIKVNIMVDIGNRNYEYTCDNILNYCGNGEFDDFSTMLWLAKQQGKEQEVRDAVNRQYRDDGWYVDRKKEKDKFTESMIQEMENLTSNFGTLTFLVEMPLFDVFKMVNIQKAEHDSKYEYEPELNTKAKSYITIDKKAMCGLFDPVKGSGSVLEIELDKDVQLPLRNAVICVEGCKMHGYDVDNVYGLVGSCWRDAVKDIKKVG